MKKQYITPEMELIELGQEGNILTGSIMDDDMGADELGAPELMTFDDEYIEEEY